MEEQRFVGKWWVPSDADRKVGGVLTVDADGRAELELVDELLYDEDSVPMVYGAAKGRDITLLDVLSKGTSRVFAQNTSAVEKSQPGAVLVGWHLDSPGQELFDHIDVQISNLTTWTRESSIQQGFTLEEQDEGMTVKSNHVTSTPIEAPTARIDAHGVKIALRHVVVYSGAKEKAWARALDIREEVTLRVSADSPRSWDGFTATLKVFRDLITLATQSGAVIGSRKLLIDVKGRPAPYRVDLYVNSGGQVVDARRRMDLLFDLSDVDLETMINKWVSIYETIRLPLDVLLGLDYIKTGFYENRMFNVASAGEGFHVALYPNSKVLTPEQHASIKARVKETFQGDELVWVKEQVSWNRLGLKARYMQLAEHPDQEAVANLLTEAEPWARWLSRMRNSIGHLDTDGIEKGVPEHARYQLAAITRALLHLVLLQELGLSAEIQRKAVNDVYYSPASRFKIAVEEDIANRR